MSESQDFKKLTPVQKCPVCGRELAKGYLEARQGIAWRNAKMEPHAITVFSSSYVISPPARADYVPALRCINCGFVAFIGKKEVTA
jgi:hypothetical protein